MSVILRENEWAKKMVQSNNLGSKPSETIRLISRYYFDEGYSRKDVRRKLTGFIVRCDSGKSGNRWLNNLDKYMDIASGRKAIDIDVINITKAEMERIDALKGTQTQRLAFTLLCLAKYRNAVNPSNGYWVNDRDSEIMAMANINTGLRRQACLYRTLGDEGLIQFSKKVDGTGAKVCFADEGSDGKVVCRVRDFRNLGYQYLKYHGGPYIECRNCGMTIKVDNPSRGRRQKYCKECAVSIAIQQRVNSVMRSRYFPLKACDGNADAYTVYMHQCPNQKRYVGITSTSLQSRWKGGIGYVDNKPFYADIQKYGWENIRHYRIAIVQNERLAKDIETFYIQKYDTISEDKGYNRALKRHGHVGNGAFGKEYAPVEVDGNGR